ncbi:hypothetical protein CEXT_373731 [Caerostris extrusa]|uniref:Uncharacterized protein n=1 Tax=Caerostris extrusa TaxID=172846 RepID=A0AAV4SNL1_CAEEX|nr:hypothetical protein CEXT_373731 [Caerostris extrusa]
MNLNVIIQNASVDLVCDRRPPVSEISNIFYESDNESFNKIENIEKYDDDYSELQDENFEDNSELESAGDSEISPRDFKDAPDAYRTVTVKNCQGMDLERKSRWCRTILCNTWDRFYVSA